MDKTDILMDSIIKSQIEKALLRLEVDLYVIQDIGTAQSFFPKATFSNTIRVAHISRESYLLARILSPRFICAQYGTRIEETILFQSDLGSISSGLQKFDIVDHKGKYVLVYSYSKNVGLLNIQKKEKDEKKEKEEKEEKEQNKRRFKFLEDRIYDLDRDYREAVYEINKLKRKLDDFL